MPRSALLAVVVLAAPAIARADDPVALDKERKVLDPIVEGNLALYPIVVTGTAPAGDYLVLDEGMKAGTVRILEKTDEEVNSLTLENRSSKPLFLMSGEVVIGGKQDRIIGKNAIVAPKTTEDVPVFCVEHGRWSGRKAAFESAGTLAHAELRKKASFGSQSEVWDEVADKNAKRKLSNETDTYRRVATDQSVKKSIRSYEKPIAKALAKLPARDKMVGFAVAMNGKVVAVETFRSPALFKKLEAKLLRSYYVEALDALQGGEAAKAPAAAAVGDFHAKAAKAKTEVVVDKPSGRTYQADDGDLKRSEVEDADGNEVYAGDAD